MKAKSEYVEHKEKIKSEEKKDLKPAKEEPGVVRKIFRRKVV